MFIQEFDTLLSKLKYIRYLQYGDHLLLDEKNNYYGELISDREWIKNTPQRKLRNYKETYDFMRLLFSLDAIAYLDLEVKGEIDESSKLRLESISNALKNNGYKNIKKTYIRSGFYSESIDYSIIDNSYNKFLACINALLEISNEN